MGSGLLRGSNQLSETGQSKLQSLKQGVALLLILTGAAIMGLAPLGPFEILPEGTVHRPPSKALGTVICLHSIFQSEETRWPVAQAMARAGFMAINLTLPAGRSFTEYTQQVEAAISNCQEPVYLWGQSMGADLVASCHHKKIRAIVTVGFPTQPSQQNELNLVGFWDELHALDEFQPSTQILAFSNHDGENFDLQGFRLAAGHFGGEKLSCWDPFVGRALLVFGILLLSASSPLWSLDGHLKDRLVGPILLSLAAVVSWQLDPCHSMARGLLLAVVLQNGRKALLPTKVFSSMVAALAAGMVVNCAPNWQRDPLLLITLPGAILCQAATGWLTLTSHLTGLACIALTAVEMVFPGKLLTLICYLPVQLWSKAPKLAFRVGKASPARALLLVGLVGLAFYEWSKVRAVGYDPDPNQLFKLLRHLAALILIPFTVFLGLARRAGRHSVNPSKL